MQLACYNFQYSSCWLRQSKLRGVGGAENPKGFWVFFFPFTSLSFASNYILMMLDVFCMLAFTAVSLNLIVLIMGYSDTANWGLKETFCHIQEKLCVHSAACCYSARNSSRHCSAPSASRLPAS